MKSFDFVCEKGHKYNEIYRSDETIPDEMPCDKCKEVGVEAVMTRVKLYPVAGYMLPSSPGSYNQGF